MKKSFKLLLAASTLAILTACGNNNSGTDTASSATSSSATTTANVQLVQSVDAYRPPASAAAQASPMKARDLSAAPTATNISMGAPLASQAAAARKNNATVAEDNMGKPLQIGFGRAVPQTASTAATQQLLKWQATKSGGQVAAINFSSTGAKGIRIGLLVTQLPETATLRFYAKGAATAFEVKGAEVLAVLAKNVAAGDKSDAGRTYMGPMIRSADATVEIELPAGVPTSAVEVSVPSVSHMFMSSQEASTVTAQNTRSSPGNFAETCQVDVMCTTPLPVASDAVGILVYDKFNTTTNLYDTFSCSGTMLNNNLQDGTNYLLTANHCISSQTVASTLYTEFKYRSLSCNTPLIDSFFPTATTGAALLYTAFGTDSTLLKLYGTPSTNVLYAGWDATTAPATSTVIHNIHHPQGDQQRLTRGTIASYFTRSGAFMFNSDIASGTILGVTQTSGTTEPGSSGSGLFKGADTNPQVIGQLFGRITGSHPTDSCADATEPRIFGRFDMGYNNGMSDYLTQGIKGVNRFYNNVSGTHFYTISATEKSYLQTDFPAQYNYEGAPFKASTITGAGLSPVHRFYNLNLGVYFYTISEPERAFVVANLPQMRYEGIAWYANATTVSGTIPLYRFYNRDKGVHFYTASASERASVIATLPQMNDEGIAYYVLP